MAFLGPVDIPNMAQTIMGFIEGVMNFSQTTIGVIQSTTGAITGLFSKLKLLTFFSLFVTIGKCIVIFFNLVWHSLEWMLLKFIPWLFVPWPPNVFEIGRKYDIYEEAGLIPWALRFAIVIATRIGNFQKCFLWYIIDIACWTLYLPFRFLFWLIDFVLNIGLVKGEHKVWNFLNDIDYYIHGPVKNYFLDQYVAMYVGDKMYKDGEIVNNPNGNQRNSKGAPNILFDKFNYKDINKNDKIIDVEREKDINDKNNNESITYDSNSLNLGFHIFHFPNSVMETCYRATSYKLADLDSYPIDDFNRFLKCISSPF
jgi:hypothetical protein